jgi:hypothetical protein
MHDKDFDIYEIVERLQRQVETQKKEFSINFERLEQEITLLKNEISLVKNEGCWLSKQNSKHDYKDNNE